MLELTQESRVIVKAGLLGDDGSGRESLFARHAQISSDEDNSYDYSKSLGVNFMEIDIPFQRLGITVSIYELTRTTSFATLLPFVVSDATVLLFCFDLTNQSTLFGVKRWYKEARKYNKQFIPFLIGTNYHSFEPMGINYKRQITKHARKCFVKMNAVLLTYVSSQENLNIQTISECILSTILSRKPKIVQRTDWRYDAIVELGNKHKDNKNKDNKITNNNTDSDEMEVKTSSSATTTENLGEKYEYVKHLRNERFVMLQYNVKQ